MFIRNKKFKYTTTVNRGYIKRKFSSRYKILYFLKVFEVIAPKRILEAVVVNDSIIVNIKILIRGRSLVNKCSLKVNVRKVRSTSDIELPVNSKEIYQIKFLFVIETEYLLVVPKALCMNNIYEIFLFRELFGYLKI